MANIHLKTALSNIRRSPFQAMAAIFVLSLTFFVITTLSITVYSTNNIIRYFETRPQIIAFLKDDINQDDVARLQVKLNKDERAKDVKYVSKEQALAIYKEATSDNPLLSELVSPSIFPASLEFSLNDLNYAEDVIGDLKKETVVDQVGFTASLGSEGTLGDTVNRLRTITKYLRIGGGVFVGILMIVSFTVLLVVMSMRLVSKRREVEILDLIGATSKFIRSPILIESLVYSFVGVLMGWLLGLILTLYTMPSLISYFSEIKVLPKDMVKLLDIFGLILAGELFLGFVLAASGSILAVKRAKKVRT